MYLIRRCTNSNDSQTVDSVNITLTNALWRNCENKSPSQVDYPCEYQLQLHSSSLQALSGISRPISISEAKIGQYLIPDAKLTWGASSNSCLDRLNKVDVNGKRVIPSEGRWHQWNYQVVVCVYHKISMVLQQQNCINYQRKSAL